MTPDKLFAILFSLFGIILTYWYFLMKKEDIVEVTDSVEILVDGGYQPDVIAIPKGKPTKITFLRTDPSSCLEEVVLSEFKIRKFLPMNKKISIEVTPQKTGEYPFSCGMNMFHGKIIVK